MSSVTPLTRAPYRPAAALALADGLAFTLGRCHEFCGPARRSLALMLAARSSGPVLWIRAGWDRQQLMGRGIRRYLDPGRLVLVEPHRAEDILWCMEEGLRAGCVPLVVAECDRPPPLTPMRRLHLAAGARGPERAGGDAPLGLVLTPGDGGAQGAESRWHLSPRHSHSDTAWLLQRRRARLAPPAAWLLRWTGQSAALSPAQP